MEESVSTWYFKRTLRNTPSGSQVSYSYTPAKARDSVSSSYRPSYGTREPNHRPKISTYRRRKYPTKNYYQVWYVFFFKTRYRERFRANSFIFIIGILIPFLDVIEIIIHNNINCINKYMSKIVIGLINFIYISCIS